MDKFITKEQADILIGLLVGSLVYGLIKPVYGWIPALIAWLILTPLIVRICKYVYKK